MLDTHGLKPCWSSSKIIFRIEIIRAKKLSKVKDVQKPETNMNISDWAKPEVAQLLEQYIQKSAESIEELKGEIQQITGKRTINNLRCHLQQFRKETAAYKQHSKEDETFNKNKESDNEIKQYDNSREAAEENRVSVEETATYSNSFGQGINLPRGMPINKRREINERKKHIDHVPDNAEVFSIRTRTFRKETRSSTRRKEELRILKSYRNHRRKKIKNVSPMTIIDRRPHEIVVALLLKINFREKKLNETTNSEHEVTVASMKSNVRPAKTAIHSVQSTIFILAKPIKPRVILRRATLTRPECIELATGTTVSIWNNAIVTSCSHNTSGLDAYRNDNIALPWHSIIPVSNNATVTPYSRNTSSLNDHRNDNITSLWQPVS
ncbi:hypothetical protein DINM_006520 [Dirofilaria immitis]|nr:hypothetical protein [Dirofilaria immitis]